MFAIPSFLLSGAWWLAKAAGIKTAAGRFFNKEAATAIAVIVGVVALLILLVWGVHTIRSQERAAADGEWKSKLADAYRQATEARAAMHAASEAAAAKARAAAAEDLEAARQRVGDLERALSKRTDKAIVYPRDIARELNK